MPSESAGMSVVSIKEMTLYPPTTTTTPRSKALNSPLLAHFFFLVSVSERNVLWEVFNTSETKQEDSCSRMPRSHPLDQSSANKDCSVCGGVQAFRSATLQADSLCMIPGF